MINELDLTDLNFFTTNKIILNKINLITGYNNTGKSYLLKYIEEKTNNITYNCLHNAIFFYTYHLILLNLDKHLLDKVSFELNTILNSSIDVFDIINNYKKWDDIKFSYKFLITIITNILISKDNSILIIECPESILHPNSQSKLINFITRNINNSQFFIKTYSEHILNAFRVNIVEERLNYNNISIFNLSKENENISIENIEINKDGTIYNWPIGFFDQFDIDCNKIFGI